MLQFGLIHRTVCVHVRVRVATWLLCIDAHEHTETAN